MTVFAVFAAIAAVFVFYFSQPECRLRGEPPCVEKTQPAEPEKASE